MQVSVGGLVLILAFPREDRGAPIGAVGGTGTESQQPGEGSWVDGTTFQSKFPLLPILRSSLCCVSGCVACSAWLSAPYPGALVLKVSVITVSLSPGTRVLSTQCVLCTACVGGWCLDSRKSSACCVM